MSKQPFDGVGALYHTPVSGILMVVTAGAYTAKECRERGGMGSTFSCLNFKGAIMWYCVTWQEAFHLVESVQ